VSCNVISQNIILNKPVVRLNEKQARAIAKDLVMGDYYKNLSKLQDKRIDELSSQINAYDDQMNINESIINEQKKHIEYQDSIINIKPKLKLHGYAGLQTEQITLNKPHLFGNVMLEYSLYSLGAIYSIQQDNKPSYGILFRYRVF
jgi:uncharacterized Ntn-hydrolase superfamily protein